MIFAMIFAIKLKSSILALLSQWLYSRRLSYKAFFARDGSKKDGPQDSLVDTNFNPQPKRIAIAAHCHPVTEWFLTLRAQTLINARSRVTPGVGI
jgi:hypothetical protein